MALPEIVVWEELRQADIAPRVWHVDGILTPGLNTLIGKKRQGKSWFSLSLAVVVAEGKPFLLQETKPGKVLYINTELDRTASHERALKLDGPLPPNLFVCHGWARGQQALTDLETVIDEYELDVVVIDMLTGIIPVGMVTNDYETSLFWNALRKVGQNKGVSILGLWHAGKAAREDFIDAAIGSTALVGQSDSVIGLTKQNDGRRVKLSVTGNHGKDLERMLVFEDCEWSLSNTALEESGPHGLKGRQLACYDIVNQRNGISAAEVAKILGLDSEQARTPLRRIVDKDLVNKVEELYYPVKRSNPGQTD